MTNISVDTIYAPAIATPPQDWKDASSYQFEAFSLHNYTQVCTTCGSVHRWSEAFRMFVRRHPATFDRRYTPATEIPPNLKVITSTMPTKRIPLCFHCLSDERVGEARILVSTDEEWNLAMKRSLEARRSTPSSAPKAPEGKLEDLL